MAPVFDDLTNNPIEQKTARLRRSMWQELRAISRIEERSVAQVIEHFLRWAIDDWRRSTKAWKRDALPGVLAEVEREEAEEEAKKAAAKPKRVSKRK